MSFTQIRYEYKVEKFVDTQNDPLQRGLNAFGAEGWELIHLELPPGSSKYTAVFKRPLNAPAA